ncbi:MAG: hypothetical protein ACKV0T_22420 [Planctomycetales bacterium]
MRGIRLLLTNRPAYAGPFAGWGKVRLGFRLLLAGVLLGWLGSSAAEAGCPPWRPCGPGPSWGGNRLIHQGFYGADFRPACANHDACLATCARRSDCDRQFLCEMYSACECSTNPKACQRKARCYYKIARLAHLFDG